MNKDKRDAYRDLLIISAIVTGVIFTAVGATWFAVQLLRALGVL